MLVFLRIRLPPRSTRSRSSAASDVYKRQDAQVLLGQDVLQQGYLYLGLSGAVDPSTVSGAHEIRGFEKIPSIRGTKFVRKALL